MLTPCDFNTMPMPTYPDIRLALTTPRRISQRIRAIRPDHVHIVTEGPLGIMARRYCLAQETVFTTSYHTRFPEYLSARLPIPEAWTYRWLRSFHNSEPRHAGRDASLAADLTGARLQQAPAMDARRRHRPFPAGRAKMLDFPRRSFSASAASRSKRTCLPSSIWICPAARWSSAKDRSLQRSRSDIPTSHFLAP